MGWRIRAIRLAKGLTGHAVAKAQAIWRPYYTQLEGGMRRLPAEHVWWIVLALDMLVGALSGGGGTDRDRRHFYAYPSHAASRSHDSYSEPGPSSS